MTKQEQPTQARPSMWAVVFDNSELEPPPALPLILTCRTCRRRFASDYEEPRCGDCVKRAELESPAT